MTLQIIILNTNSQPDGSFSVSGVFWLVPTNNFLPLPNFVSQVPFIDATDLILLQTGQIVEQSFITGLYASGTNLAAVETDLQTQYTTAQTNLTNAASPLVGIIGTNFNGVSWSSSNPFTPSSSVVSVGNLGALNANIQVSISNFQSVGVQIAAGTFIGTIVPEISFDNGINWTQTFFSTIGYGNKLVVISYVSANFALASTIVVNGGVGLVRVRVLAYTSGTCSVTLRTSNINDQTLQLFNAQPGSNLPPSVGIMGASVTTAAPAYTTSTANSLSLNTAGGLRVDGSGVTQPVSGTVATTAPTLTKGTQGTNGWPVQDLKDSGRTIQTFIATALTGSTSEALVSLTPYSNFTAGAAATSFAVTAGKTLRLQQLCLTWRNPSAASGGVTIRFRVNPTGSALVTSPVQLTLNATTSLTAIGSGMTATVNFPDGWELSGTQQFAITQLAVTAVAGVDISLIGFTY